jgi:hypothetical protein
MISEPLRREELEFDVINKHSAHGSPRVSAADPSKPCEEHSRRQCFLTEGRTDDGTTPIT